MSSEIISALSNTDRYQRYDGVKEVLSISTLTTEIYVSRDTISIFRVEYTPNTINAHHGIPISRRVIAVVDYRVFLEQEDDEVDGITKAEITAVLEYYWSLG